MLERLQQRHDNNDDYEYDYDNDDNDDDGIKENNL